MDVEQRPDVLTRFQVKGSEPLSKKVIGLRLPESLDEEIRSWAGEDLSERVRRYVIEGMNQDRPTAVRKTDPQGETRDPRKRKRK